MDTHQKLMKRCLELAAAGRGLVAPNPMVGSLITRNGQIIAEGFHAKYGEMHAERAAFANVQGSPDLKDCTLYVNLEPCAHHGNTPPCTDAIIASGIRTVVYGCGDPNPAVAGKGRELLERHGVHVISNVLYEECRAFNCRFFTFHEKNRPYVILKWAQTADGFIAREDYSSKWISSDASRQLVHAWRAEESAILVGTKTALVDNPQLTARNVPGGKNPIRIAIDPRHAIPLTHHLYDGTARTLIFCAEPRSPALPTVEFKSIDFQANIAAQILSALAREKIISVLVEGGARTLRVFIDAGLWDEARIFTADQRFEKGIAAPAIKGELEEEKTVDEDRLSVLLARK